MLPTILPGLDYILVQMGYAVNGTIAPDDFQTLSSLWPQAERLVRKFVGFDIVFNQYTEFYPPANYHAPQDPLITGYELQGGRATPIERFADERRVITLNNLPVRQIVSIYEDPNAWYVPNAPVFQTLLATTDYQPDFTAMDSVTGYGTGWSGFVYRQSGIWTNIERAIQVTYNAGLTREELDPQQGSYPEFALAVAVATQTWFNAITGHRLNSLTGVAGGTPVSESLSGFSMSFNPTTQMLNQGLFMELPQASMRILEQWQRYTKWI